MQYVFLYISMEFKYIFLYYIMKHTSILKYLAYKSIPTLYIKNATGNY